MAGCTRCASDEMTVEGDHKHTYLAWETFFYIDDQGFEGVMEASSYLKKTYEVKTVDAAKFLKSLKAVWID